MFFLRRNPLKTGLFSSVEPFKTINALNSFKYFKPVSPLKPLKVLLLGGSIATLLLSFLSARSRRKVKEMDRLKAVESLDLKRYMGKWYEIARTPNLFERNCASEITAEYQFRPDGKVSVVNSCRKSSGALSTATGVARVADRYGPHSKLKVSFFWPFEADYWVILLDDDYRWAVVGEPKRRFLWVLSRDEQMPEGLYVDLLSRINALGYDTSKVMRVDNAPVAS